MCGIVGLFTDSEANQVLYDALTVLQHRGQDAAGMVTFHEGKMKLRKGNGLVRDVFMANHMLRLKGSMGIGHVRYPTAGSTSVAEAQPIYVNSPYGISLAHNGNLTNADKLKNELYRTDRRHLNTDSDSEVLLNIFAHELLELNKAKCEPGDIFKAVTGVHKRCKGAYAAVAVIAGHGLLGFRDPHGIRPIVYGEKEGDDGKKEYMIASESVALNALGFKMVRDLNPGEAIYIDLEGNCHLHQCAKQSKPSPCIFEYVYLARPDSVVDGVSVYAAHIRMGEKLAERVKKTDFIEDVDVIIPIPDTSRPIALQMAQQLKLPYREGFIKNRYIGRTFIMPHQKQRKKSVRQKLNAIDSEFRGKNVLLVDDSIVRGTTSEQIIQMAREAGAAKVYFASASPPIRHPNVYGIDMPSPSELIGYGRNIDEICKAIGADGLVYQELDDLKACVQELNCELKTFDCSVFTGEYVTGDVDEAYLQEVERRRSDANKLKTIKDNSASMEILNAR